MLVVTVLIVDAYLLLDFYDLTCDLDDTKIADVWLHCSTWH